MRMMNETKNGSSRAAVLLLLLRPRAPPLAQKKAPYKNDF